jgi:hypothetical protein
MHQMHQMKINHERALEVLAFQIGTCGDYVYRVNDNAPTSTKRLFALDVRVLPVTNMHSTRN